MFLTRPTANTAQTMADKFSIKELIEFERFCRDNALWDEMKKCFAPDSTVNISWFKGSGWGFIDASSKQGMRAPHKIYNTLVWINQQKAFALTLATIELPSIINGIKVMVQSEAKLVYRLQKTDELWYITAFESIYEKDSIVPVYPNNELNISPNQLSKYRDSYAGMCYIADMNQRSLADDLPGIDRPDLVDKLYQDAEKWIME